MDFGRGMPPLIIRADGCVRWFEEGE